MRTGRQLPRLARWLLMFCRLGNRRAEVGGDLLEVYGVRCASHTVRYARRRLYYDVASLLIHPTDHRGVSRLNIGALASALGQDLAYALRLVRRRPVLLAVAVGGLGMAIGVSTCVFSLMNAIFLRPVGVADPARSVAVLRQFGTAASTGVSNEWPFASFAELRTQSRAASLEAFFVDQATFGEATISEPVTVEVAFASATLFDTFGGRPLAGRLLVPADDVLGAAPVAVVSYAFWTQALGRDPALLGRRIRLGGQPVTIVGILERGFTGPTASDTPPAVWVPLADSTSIGGRFAFERESADMVNVAAHLAPGASVTRAERELSILAANLPPVPGAEGPGNRVVGVRLDPVNGRFGSDAIAERSIVALISLVIVLVLLLAGANVTNLLLASAVARRSERAVRRALGATSGRLVRQAMTESLILASAGGAVGWLVASMALPTFARAINLSAAIDVGLDVRVFFFLAGASVGTAVISGLASSRRVGRQDVTASLNADLGDRGPTGRTAGSSTLVGVQATASLVLLMAAGLFVRAAAHMSSVDVGFDAAHLIRLSPAFREGTLAGPGRQAYFDDVARHVEAVPGVASAAVALYTPFGESFGLTTGSHNGVRFAIHKNETDARYFSVVGLRLLRGRPYTPSEVATGARVVVISDRLAHAFFGTTDPIGQSLFSRRVIGVVTNAITADLVVQETMAEYLPLEPAEVGSAELLIRSSGPPAAVLRPVARAADTVNPAGHVRLDLVQRGLDRQLAMPRVIATLASTLGLLALFLALMGLYGVTAFVVSQRSREIGLRMAIGATQANVFALVVRQAMRPVLMGLALGLALAVLVARIVTATVYGVSATDPVAIGFAASLLIFSASAAAMLPAHRASRFDPAKVLRET